MSKRLRWWRPSPARAARAEKPVAPDPQAPDPELSEKFAKQAHDLDAVRKSVEDAAALSAGLWLSYLFVLLYIAIAAGAVTHKDLLLENPVKLPFLNVELPLVAFFFLAPILFIVSHAYTLVHFVMLGAKVGVFDRELRAQLGDAPETREGLRRQLPSNIFVQFLAGPGDIRKGGLGLILKLIAWFSLVIGPVLLLLLIQAQFLPYHLAWVTWVQRVAVFADLIILWLLWPAVLNGRSKLIWRLERRDKRWPGVLALTGRYIVGLTACLVPIGLAFTAATFPGEWLDEHAGNKQWIPPNNVTAWLGAKDPQDKPIWTSFHDLLFSAEYDAKSQRRKSLFSNTLVLPGFDGLEAAKIDDPKKLDTIKHTLILRGRHLESAFFYQADLRKVDLTLAQLQHATLGRAQLQGASLSGAELQGASLSGAELQGALLDNAQLQGALLDKAQLQGALLDNAQLQGALLNYAKLQGASLDFAQLQGAWLDFAQLQGASLIGAGLQGASLIGAKLQGASLIGAGLQGADFQRSILGGTDMALAAVWRTSFEGASLAAVFEDGLEEKAISKDDFAALETAVMKLERGGGIYVVRSDASGIKEMLEGGGREIVLERIEKLNPAIFGPEASVGETLRKGRAEKGAYQKASTDQVISLACSADKDGVYIVRGLITTHTTSFTVYNKQDIRIKSIGVGIACDQAPGLVKAILDPSCPVFAALTEADKAALNKIAKEAGGAH